LVPKTGLEPVRPLFRKAADFKSAVSTDFTTRALRNLADRKRCKPQKVEARAGVEPTYTDLQSGA
jgi:hypothetical protein